MGDGGRPVGPYFDSMPNGECARSDLRHKPDAHRSRVTEEVWKRLVQPEKDRDPEKKGFTVLVTVERAEGLDGAPLKD